MSTTTYLVTRHPAAIEWLLAQGLTGVNHVPHLDPAQVQPGDQVVGTLPVHLAAAVCERGGRYFNLSLEVPLEARGRELSADDMQRFGARLEEYSVRAAQPEEQSSDWRRQAAVEILSVDAQIEEIGIYLKREHNRLFDQMRAVIRVADEDDGRALALDKVWHQARQILYAQENNRSAYLLRPSRFPNGPEPLSATDRTALMDLDRCLAAYGEKFCVLRDRIARHCSDAPEEEASAERQVDADTPTP